MTVFPPLRWLQQVETRLFALASEIEYRLRITPRATRLVPSAFDRRMVRLFLLVMPLLIASLFVQPRALRAKLLFGGLVFVVSAVLALLLFDAFPSRKGGAVPRNAPKNAPKNAPRSKLPPKSRRS